MTILKKIENFWQANNKLYFYYAFNYWFIKREMQHLKTLKIIPDCDC